MLSNYGRKQVIRMAARSFNDEEWAWLSRQRDFIRRLLTCTEAPQLVVDGRELLEQRKAVQQTK